MASGTLKPCHSAIPWLSWPTATRSTAGRRASVSAWPTKPPISVHAASTIGTTAIGPTRLTGVAATASLVPKAPQRKRSVYATVSAEPATTAAVSSSAGTGGTWVPSPATR